MKNRPIHALRRTAGLLTLSAAVVVFAACEDDPTDPGERPEAMIDASATEFMATEVAVGTDETITIQITNDGGAALDVQSIGIEGADAMAFALIDATAPFMIQPGGSAELRVGFAPDSEGMKEAMLAIVTNDPAQSRFDVPLRGQAARFQYTQVDRKGIPGLNTVFNHPSGIGPFDKTAYNVASPADDLSSYRDLFVTVLGAVGRTDEDANAVADLLLPDELPVAMGAAETSFATLTGRALTDDAVDVALTVVVGAGALDSDNVDANDKAFRAEFPYVAAPHGGSQ